ncbi:TatD family hydrolase [Sulfobacillus harzensis]|uniref:TatD family hydrolase n=1 Tax=Sulfobacillus harzensis TaxID=2729629 RepID=A0A7Y0Q3B1_9FIRM|nr:TatD family hydrolase [Sulfobacillus harzensis]NMP23372.1 TatD family hydrolase [Sulfobacillus harzensis]
MTLRVMDSHCHLQDEDFSPDRDAVYQRAIQEGVGVIVPGYTMDSSEKAVAFAKSHDAAWALVGVHPHDSRLFSEDPDLHQLRDWVKNQQRVVGIGEIGLDYHYDHSPRDVQRRVFEAQLALARDLGVPASVHTREAEEDTLAIIRSVGWKMGVIHCFTGTAAFAEAVLDLGWHISFSGAITFKSAHDLRAVVPLVPMNRLLIETDSPYLSPVPWRGQRNEPLRVIRVAEVVAAQKNCLTQQVFDNTLSNTLSLFSVSPNIG